MAIFWYTEPIPKSTTPEAQANRAAASYKLLATQCPVVN